MNVIVNGEKRETATEISLREFLKRLDLPAERVAVELNRSVVRRADWDETKLNEGDKIEIVHFVGGG